ncbi:MAG: SusC/RagA family TonB-linked outer membrane protein [Bacteroidales bacterium]
MKKLILIFTALLFVAGNVLIAQNIRVSGTVTEQGTGLPLPYVSIMVKGTTTGVNSLDNGTYTINAAPNATLVFSFVGYKTVEVSVNNRAKIDMELAQEAQSLDQVVMIAYGTAKKESVTGAITTVNSRAIEKRSVSSVTAVLEGQAAGIMVNNANGEPGNDPEVRVRGFSTINGSNAPMYVIDGVPFGGNITDINTQDIENISILKDAASTALYGNRASNGVILITTKRGKSEKVSVRASFNEGLFMRGVKEYEKLDAREFMEVMWKGYRNSLRTSQSSKYPTVELANAEATKTLIPTYLKYNIFNKPENALFDSNGKVLSDATILPGYDDLDWFKFLERVGQRRDYTVSAEGASDKYNYFFSVGYLDENGYLKVSDFNRFSGRTNITVTPKKWVKLGLSLSGSHQKHHNASTSSMAAFINPFMYARNIAPIYPVYLHDMATGEYILDSNGNKQYDSGGSYSRPQYAGRHVVWEYDLNKNETTRNTLNSQVFADLSFLKDFTFSIKGDVSIRSNFGKSYRNPIIGDGAGKGDIQDYLSAYKSYTFQQLLTWKKEFGKHNLEILAGHENFSHEYQYFAGFKTNEIFSGSIELRNFTVMGDLDGYQTNYRSEGYLSRARYNFDNKYFFDASYRRDGSSKFHPDKRWGDFWSVGGSWSISKEPFMAGLSKYINTLKLRASYGEVGNDAGTSTTVGYQAYMGLYYMNQNGNRGALYKDQYTAEDIVWESQGAFGVGLDGRFFDRINLSVEYFDKISRDLLFDLNLPLSAGATSTDAAVSTIKKNIGSVSNRGIEITTDVDIISRGDFRWNLGFIGTMVKNKVLSLPEQNRADGILSGNKKIMEGKDMYQFWLFQFAGVDQMTGNSLYLIDYNKYYAGDVVVPERSPVPASWLVQIGDNYYTRNITYAKQDWSGSAIPDIFGSFSTSLSYKNFDLSALLTYSYGGKAYDTSFDDLMSVNTTPSSKHKRLLQAWDGVPAGMTESSPNRIDPKGIPVIDFTLNTYNTVGGTTQYLQDASYMTIKNISMSYRLPKKLVNKLNLSDISVSLSVENLATFNKLPGMDAQQSFAGNVDNNYAGYRTFSFGVNVKL